MPLSSSPVSRLVYHCCLPRLPACCLPACSLTRLSLVYPRYRGLCSSPSHPSWQRSDLRMTRLRDPDRGEVLIFKELQWQTVKIEARSTLDQGLSPLRLITNQSHCRIVIKKKINGEIIGASSCGPQSRIPCPGFRVGILPG